MQISILNGIYSNAVADFRTAYPANLFPIANANAVQGNGISKGHLKRADGTVLFATGSGVDRGGIVWNGVMYRISGSKLIKVLDSGYVVVLGDVGDGGQCSLDYSFDNLIIASAGNLYYFNGVALSQVTDVDVGLVNDAIFVDGYTMTTDGEFLVVTELNIPMSVDPLKYGSSELDPDKITGILRLRGEVYALNRHTIEAFDNVGGIRFPFARIEGAQIQKGCVGPHAKCLTSESFAFLGGARDEPCSMYFAGAGTALKFSTREIDQRIATYSEAELSTAILETRKYNDHEHIYMHLPNETWVYDVSASKAFQEHVWVQVHSNIITSGPYRSRNFNYAYGKWICGDAISANIGQLTDTVCTQYGEITGYQFETTILYNAGNGAIIHALELSALTGRAHLGKTAKVFHSWSQDGLNWSQEQEASAGGQGAYAQRVSWRKLANMYNYRTLRFRGADDSIVSFARLEAQLEPLNA